MYSKNEIIEFLKKDIYRNINIINFMEMYPINYIDKAGNSVLVKGRSDENWIYISSSSEEELIELLSKLEAEDKCFAVAEDWMLPHIINGNELEFDLVCMKYIFPQYLDLPQNKIEVENLTIDDAEYIYNNYDYREFTSTQYLSQRISSDISKGIRVDGKLAGWVMTHDDGAIGVLNVLPEHRKKGYAYELMLAIIKELKKRNRISFLHIEENNIKSTNLALKLGFKKDRRIHWVKLK